MVFLALGGNLAGDWGNPEATLAEARHRLAALGREAAFSGFYLTEPVGAPGQAPYVNAVLALETVISPTSLLRVLKRLEKAAGRGREPERGVRRHWDARTLDIDLLDYKGRINGWSSLAPDLRLSRQGLVFPHAQMHLRPFVLQPLADMMLNTRWRHPVFRLSAAEMLRALPLAGHEGEVMRRL